MRGIASVDGMAPWGPPAAARGASAGQEGRHSVGTAVAGGMIFATFLNVLFIPVLYVVVQSLFGAKSAAPAPAAQD